VVLAAVSPGAELIADGDIHVYARMRGRALAGARGNVDARIFMQQMAAELVSIAGVYRTLEEDLPETLHERAVQVSLDGSKLVLAAMAVSG
jgi:septum site-determining protein MinC